MSQIKGLNTKPEVLIKKLLRDLKIPFKSNYKLLPGKPDIFIPALNLVIEIHGCFWHGHKKCKYFVIPRTNKDFWIEKITSNVRRDKKNERYLKEMNLRVCVLWECKIKDGSFLDILLNSLTK